MWLLVEFPFALDAGAGWKIRDESVGQEGDGLWVPGLSSTQIFGLTRLWLMWQSRWLDSDSTQHFISLGWLNSDSTQIPYLLTWLKSDLTHLSQSWVKSDSRLITFYLLWPQMLTGGWGVLSNVAFGWFFPCSATDKCKISTFSLQNIWWLNFDSSSIQLTQLWLKWRSTWFDSDSTHILDFHGRLNSDSTHLSQSRVKFDSRLMSRAQPWWVP